MNVLLVYPKYPDTYWSFKHAVKFILREASNIPLGLVTIASLLPGEWNKKLIDMNVSKLRNEDIIESDYVMISAMSVQRKSANEVIDRCRKLGVKTVVGGPLFTEEYDQFPQADHFVLNEAEITLPAFLKDLKAGKPLRFYHSTEHADIRHSPLPDYSLLKLNRYTTAGIQYSRGCPYDCEFCDITALFGHKVRTKTTLQIINELDNIYNSGWRGAVFFVDDNFIGHKRKLKQELLPAIISWMKKHKYPYHYITEASVNLADDPELMIQMVEAGFTKVFVGIETPEELSLKECNKVQNNGRNLLEAVETIQASGLEVAGGFIVGFDNDPPDIFQRQVQFIQQSGIITAMVGLLNAPRLSKLYRRMQSENRIINSFSGDNTDYSMNFIPLMDKDILMEGYRKLLTGIYSPKQYHQRVKHFLAKFNPPPHERRLSPVRIFAFVRSVVILGILRKERKYYWNLLFWTIRNKPSSFPLAVTYSIYGFHFRKVFGIN